MPSTSAAESLAEEAGAFLEQALVKVVPERDIHASEVLCRRILESWPVDNTGWTTARRELAEALAERFKQQPQQWARALRLVALYLNRATLDELHPRHSEEHPVMRAGKRIYIVEFDLDQVFAEALLKNAGSGQRSLLWDTLDEWDAWQAVARALATIRPHLDAPEIAILLTRAAGFARGDSAADSILEPIREGLSASADSVDEILARWFENTDLNLVVVGLLALWRLPEREDGATLRRRLVRQLLRLPPRQGAWVAMHVAFRSWPDGAELEARRELLVECLEYLGGEGVLPALGALTYDRNTPPQAALRILDAIIAHVDQAHERAEEIALARVEVLRWIVRETERAGQTQHVALVIGRLPSPETLPFSDHALRRLDRLLATLARSEVEVVRAYVLDWIEARFDGLGRGHSLDQLLPKTRSLLPGAGWLLEASVSARPKRRLGAMRCLVDTKARPTPEDFGGLDKLQVLALGHVILSDAASGAGTLDLLFELARARNDCLGALESLVGQEAMRTYPGQHQRAIEAWAAVVEGRPEDDPERIVVTRLQELIARRRAVVTVKRELSVMLFDRTSPARRPTAEFLARAFQAGMDESNSLFRTLATRVPIACGAASSWEFGDGDARGAQPFQEVTHTVEGPYLDSYDPVAAHYFRIAHERRAQELLSESDKGES